MSAGLDNTFAGGEFAGFGALGGLALAADPASEGDAATGVPGLGTVSVKAQATPASRSSREIKPEDVAAAGGVAAHDPNLFAAQRRLPDSDQSATAVSAARGEARHVAANIDARRTLAPYRDSINKASQATGLAPELISGVMLAQGVSPAHPVRFDATATTPVGPLKVSQKQWHDTMPSLSMQDHAAIRQATRKTAAQLNMHDVGHNLIAAAFELRQDIAAKGSTALGLESFGKQRGITNIPGADGKPGAPFAQAVMSHAEALGVPNLEASSNALQKDRVSPPVSTLRTQPREQELKLKREIESGEHTKTESLTRIRSASQTEQQPTGAAAKSSLAEQPRSLSQIARGVVGEVLNKAAKGLESLSHQVQTLADRYGANPVPAALPSASPGALQAQPGASEGSPLAGWSAGEIQTVEAGLGHVLGAGGLAEYILALARSSGMKPEEVARLLRIIAGDGGGAGGSTSAPAPRPRPVSSNQGGQLSHGQGGGGGGQVSNGASGPVSSQGGQVSQGAGGGGQQVSAGGGGQAANGASGPVSSQSGQVSQGAGGGGQPVAAGGGGQASNGASAPVSSQGGQVSQNQAQAQGAAGQPAAETTPVNASNAVNVASAGPNNAAPPAGHGIQASGSLDGVVGDFRQGMRADCGTLTGIMSLASDPQGKALIKAAIHDNGDGTYAVTLPGATGPNKTFTVTAAEISQTAVQGDSDAKLLEVAMDKALGAEGQGSGDLKRPEDAIRLLSGKPASYLHFGEVSANLGSIKQALADGKSVTFHADYNSDSQSFGMPGSGFLHASMITRIDGDSVFYRNPHDSSKEGNMPLSLLAGGAEVFIADV